MKKPLFTSFFWTAALLLFPTISKAQVDAPLCAAFPEESVKVCFQFLQAPKMNVDAPFLLQFLDTKTQTPVAAGEFKTILKMPMDGMEHFAPPTKRTETGVGNYTVHRVIFTMEGAWKLFIVRKSKFVEFDFQVGDFSTPHSGHGHHHH
jgi:hypothetical protein